MLRFDRAAFIPTPSKKSASVQREKDRAADRHCYASGQDPEDGPTRACNHKKQKPNFAFVSKEINARQTANRRQPIDAVILHMSSCAECKL